MYADKVFRWIITVIAVIFLILISPINRTVNEMAQEDVPEVIADTIKPIINDWEIFYLALCIVESGNNPNAIGKTNDGGIIQATPIYIKDCNRILGYDKYTLECRFDPIKSREMFDIIQMHYNPTKNIKRAIQLHNPKAGGWYEERIMKEYHKLIEQNL